MLDIDTSPTDQSRGLKQSIGTQRFDALLSELRNLLDEAPERADQRPEPMRRRASAHG